MCHKLIGNNSPLCQGSEKLGGEKKHKHWDEEEKEIEIIELSDDSSAGEFEVFSKCFEVVN